jgi:hypothetical protein
MNVSAAAPSLLARARTASVITFALSEAIAVLGLVLFLLGGARWDYYGFMAGSLLAFALYSPRRHDWERWVVSARHRAPD